MSLALSLLKLSVNQPLAESLMIPQVEADLTFSQGMPVGEGHLPLAIPFKNPNLSKL